MQRVVKDTLIALGAVLLLLVVLVSIDGRVRDRVERLVITVPNSTEIGGIGADIENMSTLMYEAVRDQSVEHAPLVIFGVAAAVLVLFMVRT